MAPFFERALIAAGRHLAVTPEHLSAAVSGKAVEVVLGAACRGGNDAWIAELTVNMLARLYPSISLRGDQRVCADLASLATAINPGIDISDQRSEGGIRLAIGGARSKGRVLTAAADGWVASAHWGNRSAKSTRHQNPYAAGASACFLVAEVFRTVFSERLQVPDPTPSRRVSLLDFGEVGSAEAIAPCSLGSVGVVGLGAVGTAAAWAWARHDGLTGSLDLIEPETIELSNLQRYVLPVLADVGREKLEVVGGALRHTALELTCHSQSLSAFASRFSDSFPLRTLCVSVDNVAGRRQAQALLPRTVINGWTSATGLGASWHRLTDPATPCLACLYQPGGIGLSQTELVAEALGLEHMRATALWITGAAPTNADLQTMAAHLAISVDDLAPWRSMPLSRIYVDLVCGAVAMDLGGTGHAEAVPLCHQSVLAGILMAAELVKRTNPGLESRAQPEPVVAWDDVLRPPPSRWAQPRARHARCFCQDPTYSDVYRDKWTD